MSTIEKITFPANQGYRYYKLHYSYVLETIKAAGIKVELSNHLKQLNGNTFEIRVNEIPVAMDFFDFPEVKELDRPKFEYYFKFHYTKGIHTPEDNIYPFPPISFHNWNQYHSLKKRIEYKANSDLVLNNQKSYRGHVKYRSIVQELLKKKFGNQFDMTFTSQEAFWQKINNCLVSICVPGARNDMLDRGQHQYFAFGACTISPELVTMLPGFTELVPGEHYIACAPDYSDLMDKIEWCKHNRDECIQIGMNAQQLFEERCSPIAIWNWVSDCMFETTNVHHETIRHEL